MRWSIVLIIIVAVDLLPIVHRNCHAAPADENNRSEAQRAYTKGVAAFRARRFDEARRLFEHAYLLDSSPILLYNLARVNEELGRFPRAIYYYRLYLKRAPKADDWAAVEGRIDGLERATKFAKRRPVPGQERKARRRAAPQVASAAVRDEGTAVAPIEADESQPLLYVGLGLGAAALVTGAYFAVDLRSQGQAFDRADSWKEKQAKEERGETAATLANASFALGGVLLATTATMWWLRAGSESQVSVSVAPTSIQGTVRW